MSRTSYRCTICGLLFSGGLDSSTGQIMPSDRSGDSGATQDAICGYCDEQRKTRVPIREVPLKRGSHA